MSNSTYIDLTGKKFGMLYVISRAENKGKRIIWNCLCDCGKTALSRGDFLKNEQAPRSCGCMNKTLKNRALTQARLKELFSYSEETGEFIRVRSLKGGVKKGFKTKGHPGKSGRFLMSVDGRKYLTHRLVWMYVHGEFPNGEIDHIDNNPSNNLISNLRVGTKAQNMQNLVKPKINNTSGYLGVRWCKVMRAWQARISKNRVCENLGYFSTAKEAGDAYINRKRELHEFCTI